MPPLQGIIVKNVFKNISGDTYGQVDVSEKSLTATATSLIVSAIAGGNDLLATNPSENATTTIGPSIGISRETDSITNSSTSSSLPTPAVTTTVTTTLPYLTTCINGTSYKLGLEPVDFSAIPTKEIVIVIMMLALWLFSILQTRKAWYRLLKE